MKKLLLVGVLLSGTAAFGQVLTEDFESVTAPNLPAGWSTVNVAGAGNDAFFTGNNTDANAGGYFPVPAHGQFAMTNDDVCNCTMAEVYLEMPSMDFTGMSGMGITYAVVDDGTYGGNPHSVEVSTDGGTTWNNVYTHTFNSNVVWENVTFGLGSSTDNQSDVRVRFKYDDGGTWATGVAIDDIVVDALPPVEAELSAVNLPRYAAMSSNTTLSVDVTNLGANTITSIEIDWNDGTAHTQTISTNIVSGATVAVNHPTPVNYAVATEASIDVTIVTVNGGADANAANNTGNALHNTVSQIVTKNVLFEEGTGTWCGWCPRGAVTMDYMYSTYNQFIGIAVHNGDPMTVTAYDNAANFSGFPGSNVDRALLDQSVSQTNWTNMYNDRKDMIVPAGITMTPSGTGSSITMDVTATFYTPFAAADYRLAVVMVEDGVTGTSSGYNQTNYYAGGSNGTMGGYESLPNPVPAAQMVYNHVGRALVGGYNGQSGSVPATLTDGQAVNYTFNYTVPAAQNRDNMRAVVLLIDQTNGEVVQAEEFSVSEAGIAELDYLNMNVYPNPATETMNITFEAISQDYLVKVIDLQGRVVMAGDYSNLSGKQLISVPVADLAKGSYMVSIETNDGTKTMNVVVE